MGFFERRFFEMESNFQLPKLNQLDNRLRTTFYATFNAAMFLTSTATNSPENFNIILTG
jgi:hypothetical protein